MPPLKKKENMKRKKKTEENSEFSIHKLIILS